MILTYFFDICAVAVVVFYQVFGVPSRKYHISIKNTLNQDSRLNLQEDKIPF